MKRTLTVLAVLVFPGALAACNNPPTRPGSIDANLRLELTGPSTIAPGQLAEYRLFATSASGLPRDVSLEADWRSSTEAVVGIPSPGRATAQQPGEAVITAVYQGRPATILVFVVPSGTFALKGTVREQLTDALVAGAVVQVLSNSAVVLETTTGSDGRYQLYGAAPGSGLRVSKQGYLETHRPLEISDHTLALDMVLKKLGVPDTYTGIYTLTLEIDGECSGLPDAAKIRTYTAKIEEIHDSRLTANFVVTLTDATFMHGCGTNLLAPGLGCDQFFAQRGYDALSFTMADFDWGEGGQITERLPDGTWLSIVGAASGRFEGSILLASGVAQVWYCPVPQESAWQCHTTFCETGEFRLRFSRRQ